VRLGFAKWVLPVVGLAGFGPGLGAVEVPELVDAALIPNYVRLSPSLAVAGQPAPGALRKLRELGFKTVVNLRAEAEAPPEEAGTVRATGLTYVSIPVTAQLLTPAVVDAVQKVVFDPAAAPVLLHCASANRVGAVIALMESRRGKSEVDAIAAGVNAGLRDPALGNVVRRLISEERSRRTPSPPSP
jgi:uncharacterized protein (TIGR01244 family)